MITIVEIKVSRADLLGDCKWPDYLDYCDRFFWAVPAGFALAPFEQPCFHPGACGLLVADRDHAAIVRDAAIRKLPAARRKAETLRFASRAARRLVGTWIRPRPDSSDRLIGGPAAATRRSSRAAFEHLAIAPDAIACLA